MSVGGSVSVMLRALRTGDDRALAGLHARYWPLVVGLARRSLRGAPARAVDEEDVAQQAFWSFFESVRAGRLPRLDNRHDLLAALTHITACKAIHQLERELGTQKRGQGRVQGESVFDRALGSSSAAGGLEQAAVESRNPADEVAARECYEHYLQRLPEPLRAVARLDLAGLSNREMAEQLGCVERTVERKRALLRAEWQAFAAEAAR